MLCADLAVPMEVMQHVVHVESSRNPYAIGVVGARLARQPKNLQEAIATAQKLEQNGYNFSLGLAQVNRHNLKKYGILSYEAAFDPCTNLRAGSQILRECYNRSGANWGKSFSCYYSGNFTTGFKHGYVKKIFSAINNKSAKPLVLAQNGISATRPRRGGALPPAVASAATEEAPLKDFALEYTASADNPAEPAADAVTEPVLVSPSDNAFVF